MNPEIGKSPVALSLVWASQIEGGSVRVGGAGTRRPGRAHTSELAVADWLFSWRCRKPRRESLPFILLSQSFCLGGSRKVHSFGIAWDLPGPWLCVAIEHPKVQESQDAF